MYFRIFIQTTMFAAPWKQEIISEEVFQGDKYMCQVVKPLDLSCILCLSFQLYSTLFYFCLFVEFWTGTDLIDLLPFRNTYFTNYFEVAAFVILLL